MDIKTFIINFSTATIQYYDYKILSLAVPLISSYLFPHLNSADGAFYTFLLITLSYFPKPFGSVILGKIGDIYGRSTSINTSLIITSISSFLIFLLPYYQVTQNTTIILLFILMTILFAFSSPGTDGVRLFVYEKIDRNKKCLGTGMVCSSTMIGVLIANLVIQHLSYLSSPYNWSIPIMIGAIISIIILIIRSILDSHDNYIAEEKLYKTYKDMKLSSLLQQHKKLFLFSFIIAGSIGSINSFYLIFLPSYNATILKLVTFSEISSSRSIALLLCIIGGIISGITADKIGKQKCASIAVIIMIILVLSMTWQIYNEKFFKELYILGGFLLPFMTIPALVTLKSSIPSIIRYRILSLAHALGSVIISGTTNSIVSYIYASTHIKILPIIYFIIILLLMLHMLISLDKIKKLS